MTDAVRRLSAALADRYRLERELGQGGMATVYLAQDLRHDRKVAVKVLRPELAAVIGAERFLSEIKTTANLQHPHILPLFDSGKAIERLGGSSEGQSAEFLFYVMPYIEGESLRDRLNREKQLPIADAMRIATEVASALDYAHRHGVVHRDIKPENILLHDGQALVADFGIALAASKAGGTRMTETGMSLGTPTYMSPEQAMGEREITARSDVYALGCITYEMLVGEPPFSGPTAQSIVAKVMTEKPASLIARRDRIPLAVEDAILTALEKLPADRFATATEFATALEGGGRTDRRTVGRTHATLPSARPPIRPSILYAGLLSLAALAAWGWWRPKPSASLARFVVALPSSQMLVADVDGSSLAISEDGQRFIYTGASASGVRQLYLRELGQLEAKPIGGTEDAINPFFSPDGQWVGFATGSKLKRVALAGGAPIVISDAFNSRGAAWGPKDVVIYDVSNTTGLSVISAGGGTPEVLTTLDSARQEISHRWPAILPGGKAVLFTIWRSAADNPVEIAVVSLETHQVKRLIAGGTHAQYAPTGHLVYGTLDGALLAVPFDLRRLEVTGAPVSILQGVLAKPSSGNSDFAISPSGTLAYVTGKTTSASLALVDRAGKEQVLGGTLSTPESPRVSPDGRRIALDLAGTGTAFDIWVYSIGPSTLTRFTFGSNGRYPSWSPDGRQILFSAEAPPARTRSLFAKPSDGSGEATLLATRSGQLYDGVFSPDGRYLVYRETMSETGNMDLFALRLSGDTTPLPIVATPFNERSPTLSPDGHWLAYTSNESGRDEVYVRAFPGPGGRWQVSNDGGSEPLWNPKGRELFFRSSERFVSVSVQTSPSFSASSPTVLFSGRYISNANHTNYDIEPDGRRFVVLKSGDEHADLVVVLNWFQELKQRVGK
jgi:eukaryotic-like serine/threonine-protein kinase